MAITTGGSKHLTMKLLIDKRKGVVLFAEAGKDVVDFIFHLLALPMGTVIRLLNKTEMVGSLGNLYNSFETLDNTYLQSSSYNKDILLKPKTLLFPPAAADDTPLSTQTHYYRCPRNYPLDYYMMSSHNIDCRNYITQNACAKCPVCKSQMIQALTMVLPEAVASSSGGGGGGHYYRCSRNYPTAFAYDMPKPIHIKTCRDYMTQSGCAVCPVCKSQMNQALTVVAPEAVASSSGGGGYVKGGVTYMVMDNLEVKPMSNISSIALLSKCQVSDLSTVEEKVVDFGYEEGLKLLKASMESTNALTNVFLRTNKRPAATNAL